MCLSEEEKKKFIDLAIEKNYLSLDFVNKWKFLPIQEFIANGQLNQSQYDEIVSILRGNEQIQENSLEKEMKNEDSLIINSSEEKANSNKKQIIVKFGKKQNFINSNNLEKKELEENSTDYCWKKERLNSIEENHNSCKYLNLKLKNRGKKEDKSLGDIIKIYIIMALFLAIFLFFYSIRFLFLTFGILSMLPITIFIILRAIRLGKLEHLEIENNSDDDLTLENIDENYDIEKKEFLAKIKEVAREKREKNINYLLVKDLLYPKKRLYIGGTVMVLLALSSFTGSNILLLMLDFGLGMGAVKFIEKLKGNFGTLIFANAFILHIILSCLFFGLVVLAFIISIKGIFFFIYSLVSACIFGNIISYNIKYCLKKAINY